MIYGVYLIDHVCLHRDSGVRLEALDRWCFLDGNPDTTGTTRQHTLIANRHHWAGKMASLEKET